MSQLFRSFRKRQKIWLAVLGVMLMIAFAFGSVATLGPSSSTPTDDPVVVTTKFGKVTETEIQRMLQARNIINQFLLRLMQETAVAVRQEKALPNLNDQQLFNLLQSQMQRFGMLNPATEASVIQQYVLQRKATELGVVVSDSSVNEFLRYVTLNMLTSDQIRNLLTSMNLTQGKLFDGLRGILMVSYMENITSDPLRSLPPAARWELFRRTNETATAQVLPVKVEDFVGQVSEPTDAELRAYFEEFKGQPAVPGDPEPGFYQPAKAQFQYAKADLEALMKVAEEKVTDEEVKEFYEKNKDRFPYSDFDPPAEEEPKADEEAAEEPASDKPAEDAPQEETPADAPATEASPADEKPASEETPAADQQSSHGGSEAALSGQAGDDLLLAQADTSAVTFPPTDGGQELESTAPLSFEDQLNRLSEQWSLPSDLRDGPRPEFEPLWKVEKRIRQQLAFERIYKDIEADFAKLREKMTAFYDEHYDEFQKFNVALRDHQEPPVPPKFDLAEAIKEFPGLSADETPLLSAVEMQVETDIGKSVVDRQPFGIVAFQSLRPFFIRESQDFLGNRYLFWKTNEVKEFVPTFEQVREQVVREWKLREARKLALAHAEELAARAREAKKPLQEVFAGDAGLEVASTGPFSWLTHGSVPVGLTPNQPPRLSTVQGVSDAGQSFMRTVFHLAPGEVGVAMNQPEDVAYVVQLESTTPSETVLRETFMASNFNRYASSSQIDRQELSAAWSKQIKNDSGLDWERMAK
ncbi:MAG: hypothetical protein KF708_21670 [Pirellulales bacterium]|nr:hypothetical protein [Pirellulales bacterium]